MTETQHAFTAPITLPATPRVLAQSVGSGYVPCIYEAGGIKRLIRKAKSTPEAALRYAERVIWYRQIRTAEAKRKLAAISDERWLRIMADMRLQPMIAHQPVNRERSAFDGWQI